MLSVEVSINGSPAWLVTASQEADAVAEDGALPYTVSVYDAAGLEAMRMAGEDPRPLTTTTVAHVRADGALQLAAAATTAIVDAAGSGEVDEKLIDRIRGA